MEAKTKDNEFYGRSGLSNYSYFMTKHISLKDVHGPYWWISPLANPVLSAFRFTSSPNRQGGHVLISKFGYSLNLERIKAKLEKMGEISLRPVRPGT